MTLILQIMLILLIISLTDSFLMKETPFNSQNSKKITNLIQSLNLQLNSRSEFGEVKKVEVCTIEKYCKRKGSAKIWKLFQELAPEAGVEIEESECFFECQTGPNVRLDGSDKRIHGEITSEMMVRKVLGLSENKEE